MHLSDKPLKNPETVCQEADRLVSGDRQEQYGHPWVNFTRIAELATPLLKHKLKPGCFLEPKDVAFFLIALKLARELNGHKRDSIVDAIGYLKILDMLEEYERSMDIPTKSGATND